MQVFELPLAALHPPLPCSLTTPTTLTAWRTPGPCWHACSTPCQPTGSPPQQWTPRSRRGAGGLAGGRVWWTVAARGHLLLVDSAGMPALAYQPFLKGPPLFSACQCSLHFPPSPPFCPPPPCHCLMQIAGYRMHQAYRGQFTKLLQYIDAQFLPALGTSNDSDARAVYTRWVGWVLVIGSCCCMSRCAVTCLLALQLCCCCKGMCVPPLPLCGAGSRRTSDPGSTPSRLRGATCRSLTPAVTTAPDGSPDGQSPAVPTHLLVLLLVYASAPAPVLHW
jgi:hypothetical protein